MPFFTMVNDGKIEDLDGTANLEAAKVEARKDIDEITPDPWQFAEGDWSKYSIEICDPDGALLLAVPFSNNWPRPIKSL